eukprot:1160462-Pelagomonas_calceolata.AAC.3
MFDTSRCGPSLTDIFLSPPHRPTSSTSRKEGKGYIAVPACKGWHKSPFDKRNDTKREGVITLLCLPARAAQLKHNVKKRFGSLLEADQGRLDPGGRDVAAEKHC